MRRLLIATLACVAAATANAAVIIESVPTAPISTVARPSSTIQPEDWVAYGAWIQLASRYTLDEAVGFTRLLDLKDTFVFESTTLCHCYVVAVGPFSLTEPATAFTYLMERGKLPWDSFIVTGAHFGNLVWRKLGDAPINPF